MKPFEALCLLYLPSATASKSSVFYPHKEYIYSFHDANNKENLFFSDKLLIVVLFSQVRSEF
jgi:hypothetical protein